MPRAPLGQRIGVFLRFARLQFLPVIVAPLLVGTAAAWFRSHAFDPLLFALLLLGSACLLVASNSIDDVYDFLNGVDSVSETMFPKTFPGWKPIPRGLLSVGQGLAISFSFYSFSIAIGLYLATVVGWIALAIAVPGVLLSYFYVAPPAKLDYRGLALGELAILLSFGPIPALGAFYVLTRTLSWLPVMVGLPSGLLTVNVLLHHDMIFYDSYKAAAKRSLTVVLGRIRAERLTVALGGTAYLLAVLMVVLRLVPPTCLLLLFALPLFVRGASLTFGERSVPEYAARTQRAFLHSVLFSLLFALGLVL